MKRCGMPVNGGRCPNEVESELDMCEACEERMEAEFFTRLYTNKPGIKKPS